jgi:hypothetical protein
MSCTRCYYCTAFYVNQGGTVAEKKSPGESPDQPTVMQRQPARNRQVRKAKELGKPLGKASLRAKPPEGKQFARSVTRQMRATKQVRGGVVISTLPDIIKVARARPVQLHQLAARKLVTVPAAEIVAAPKIDRRRVGQIRQRAGLKLSARATGRSSKNE